MNPDGVPSNRKVILISATPQNNRPRDILHQLRLFPVSYSRLPYRGESLEDYFRRVEGGREPLTNLLQYTSWYEERGSSPALLILTPCCVAPVPTTRQLQSRYAFPLASQVQISACATA